MVVTVRRALAGSAAGLVLVLGSPVAAASAETPTPTPVAATASPNGTAEPVDDAVPPSDNSRLVWALGGAGAVAVAAAAMVFLRRR